MKIGGIRLLLLTLGVVGIAFASVGMTTSQQSTEMQQLQTQLTLAKMKLGKIQLEPLYTRLNDLQSRLRGAQIKTEAAKASIRQSLDSVPITSTVFQLAERSNVTIVGIVSPEISTEAVGTVPCAMLSFTISASGSLESLVGFIQALGTSFGTAMIQQISLAAAGSEFSASIRINVYAYGGS